MCRAIDYGIVTRDTPVSYWPIFPSLVTFPEVFAEVNFSQFPFRMVTGVCLL